MARRATNDEPGDTRASQRREAHDWLVALLARFDLAALASGYSEAWSKEEVREAVLAELDAQPPRLQVDVLKECLERMPALRQGATAQGAGSPAYASGSILYGIACTLYRRKLPLEEGDICELLGLAKHYCGHGGDVQPPFDIALAHARKHGVSRELLAALAAFNERLTGLGTTQTRALQRKAGLLLLLAEAPGKGAKACWSDRFRAGLASLPAGEQAAWRRLVLDMKANDLHAPPAHWQKPVKTLLTAVGPDQVLTRLGQWWPDPKESAVWPLQTAGSHVLKYLIWLLDALPGDRADDLVRRLSELDWKPRERGEKVMVAAARYLAQRPGEIGGPALERLAAWSRSLRRVGGDPDRIAEIIAKGGTTA